MPAYNAERTVDRTYLSLPRRSFSLAILVDDHSKDGTVSKAHALGIDVVIQHDSTKGYGANQKTCYREALKRGADLIAMIHPDYQYDGRLLPYFVGFIEHGVCDVILGNRIRSRQDALAAGMPIYKYIANRMLTFLENICLGTNLGDCHSGFRLYTRKVLESIPFEANNDGFVFDSQLLAQAAFFGFKISDAPIPCRYFPDASSINFQQSILYGIGTMLVLAKYCLASLGWPSSMFARQ